MSIIFEIKTNNETKKKQYKKKKDQSKERES